MPDFVGQTFDEAEALLRRYNTRITKKVRISPEPAGTIVDQEPVGGAPFTPNVTLFVSVAPPTVPDAVGKSFGDASTDLERLGFSVVEVPRFDETRQDGLVLEQSPPAGSSNAGEVTLTVARTPVVFYVGYDVEAVATSNFNHYETGTSNSNGSSYSHSLRLNTYAEEGASAEFNLGRSYRQLRSFVGIDDDSRDSDAQFRVEIFGDGRLLWGDTIALGETKEIDADVTDVLRLKIFVINLARAESILVLGDARLNGLPAEVPATTVG
jgi:hypothetical protein